MGMNKKPWIYQDRPIEEAPEEYQGFVYVIRNDLTGKLYVGKKNFISTTRVKQKGKTRRKVVRKESDWRNYYGSNDALKADVEQHGEDNFTREIIKLCRSKSEMSYFETKEIFERDALLKEDYYNQWVSTRIHASTLRKMQD